MELANARDQPLSCVELSPHSDSAPLLAYTAGRRLHLGLLQQSSGSSGSGAAPSSGLPRLDERVRLPLAGEATALSWSPLSSHDPAQQTTKAVVCVATRCPFQLVVHTVAFGDDDAASPTASSSSSSSSSRASSATSVVLEGHTAEINSTAFDASGEWLASTGDDATLRISNARTGKLQTVRPLSAAGVAVVWHPRNPHEPLSAEEGLQLLVALRNGVIQLQHITSPHPLRSFQAPSAPLTSADWFAASTDQLGAAAGGCWHVWSRTQTSLPVASGSLPVGKGAVFRASRISERIFAAAGNAEFSIVHIDDQAGARSIVSCDGHASALSWHATQPWCVAALGSSLRIFSTV